MTDDRRPQIDPDKLMALRLPAVDEVGATLNTALVVMGDKLGYYRALADGGPYHRRSWPSGPTPASTTPASGSTPRPPAAIVEYDPATAPLHAARRARRRADRREQPGVPARVLPDRARHGAATPPRSIEAARSGDGIGWHEHNTDVHVGLRAVLPAGYHANLVPSWLPALDGVVDKLERGRTVADVGCGHGASTILMAEAFPHSTFVGSDYHPGSIETARERAAEAGVADRVTFEVAPATAFTGTGYDLVTTFDALHDMGDPVGAARHVRESLAADGTWMVVEPMAGDRVEDNLNPVGRAYYGFSTLLCTPGSLSQDVGLALGTQAGPARIRDVTTAAGFTRFRMAAETPFNTVFEVRP